ncbi:MAG: hypothetical protein Kow0020_03140 [Wenzhouxiangellaceae bacterium]
MALLRVGFAVPSTVTRDAVRSYRTFSPLPAALLQGCRRSVFCGTFRGLAPPRHYLAPCPVKPGLSSAQYGQRLFGRLLPGIMTRLGRGKLQATRAIDPIRS